MIIYGTKIISDIGFQTRLFEDGDYIHTLKLSSLVPKQIHRQLFCGTYLHTTHQCKIYLYTHKDIKNEFTSNEPLCYEIDSKLRFYWYHGTFDIYYEMIDVTQKEFEFWFIHTFLSFFLSVEKHFVLLHGSAIEIDNKAVLFLAPYKSGKSTLTYYMSTKHNHKLITDDILATFMKSDKIIAVPSHPHSRPNRGFWELGYHIKEATNRFKSLSSIYILADDRSDTIHIQEIKGIEKFILAKKNSIIYTLPNIKLEHEKYFGQMLNTIPFFKINRPWGKRYIPQVYNTILQHQQTL
jgi:hypothetical protein